MSIDHGKLLALLKIAKCPNEGCIDGGYYDERGEPCQCQWCDERNRALAQPAEAVEGDAHLKAAAQWFISALGDLPDDYASLTSEKVQSALSANRHAYDEAMSGSLGSDDAAQGAVATVCLVGERYAHGHMVSVELQLASEDAPAPNIGDRYYTHPQAAQGAVARVEMHGRCKKVRILDPSVEVGTKLYTHPQAAPAQVPLIARAKAEWHEDDGAVMWWAWCGHGWAGEPAWCGTPNDSDWPGYHTHWTSHPKFPAAPTQEGE